MVRVFAAPPADHLERQVEPLTLKWWACLEALTGEDDVFVRTLAFTWVVLLLACLRFAHWNRCSLDAVDAFSASGMCSMGKSRVRGARRAFRWTLPRFGLLNVDLGPRLNAYIADQNVAGSNFMLRDFEPPRAPLAKVNGFGPRPMSLNRFGRFSYQLFVSEHVGMTRDEAIAFTNSYAARRCLPTIASLSQLGPLQLLALGDWQSAPGASKAEQKEASSLRMPIRYSDARTTLALAAKQECIAVARFVRRRTL